MSFERERLTDGAMMGVDREIEQSLRPKNLSEYIGQYGVKNKMKIFIEAARMRNEPLDHVLLYGPPGLGKTTLASIIANELNVNIRVTSGPAIEKPKDLAGLFSNLNPGDILFIDEIHRLNHSVEEVLYPAMEDYALDIIIGEGIGARSIRVNLPHFTLIGATTRAGMLTAPLLARFGIVNRLEMYSNEELYQIIWRSASIVGVTVSEQGAFEIARRSRGTPRIANRLLRRVRDYAQVIGDGDITKEMADEALQLLEVDAFGLDAVDRRIIEALIVTFAGRPVGLETLSAVTGEDPGTIEDMYEPYLMQIGFVSRTPRGRVAQPAAYRHLGLPPPDERNDAPEQMKLL